MKAQISKFNVSELEVVGAVLDREIESLQSETPRKGKKRVHQACIDMLSETKTKLTNSACFLDKNECATLHRIMRDLLGSFCTDWDATGKKLVRSVERNYKEEGNPVTPTEVSLYLKLHAICG